MGPLLRALAACALVCAAAIAQADEPASDRHQWRFEIDASYSAAESPLAPWVDGGLGKLRYAERNDGIGSARLFAEYRGRIAPTLTATVVLDYLDDASHGLGVPEAFLDWRPIPRSANQHQIKLGAFYPPLSLENGELGWQSPFTYSYSALNTWLGEEIRPVGAEWSLRRRLGGGRSAQELRAFAAGFYGNDPAGTLLFWRGWSLHDRQTRLGDRLPMPPLPIWDSTGTIVGHRDHSVEPLAELDHEPGAYGGLEWRYARRVLVAVARYDNRADPSAFAGGQWGWDTAFWHAGLQASLPRRIGLVAQWMRGRTEWISGARSDGTLAPSAALVDDEFEARFWLLTATLGDAHRLSLRRDAFAIDREFPAPLFHGDGGRAWTLAYRYRHSARLNAGIEWLAIDSRRDLWPLFYAAPEHAVERAVRVQASIRLGPTAR